MSIRPNIASQSNITGMDKEIRATSNNSDPAISKIWYKNYMVWIFVIGFPVAMVIMCVWMLNFSIVHEDPVVRDDWYMDAKTLYADVSKDKLAHDKGLFGHMQIDSAGNVSFDLILNQPNSMVLPKQLQVEISHATQKDKDRDFIMTQQEVGHYVGQVRLADGPGKYYIIIHDLSNTWRLRDTVLLPTKKILNFRPLTAFDTLNRHSIAHTS